MKNRYEVGVANIGSMPYTNKLKAIKAFNEYVKMSIEGYGRAAGENVVLRKVNHDFSYEIISEHIGTMNQE